jgi:hypothetical protein
MIDTPAGRMIKAYLPTSHCPCSRLKGQERVSEELYALMISISRIAWIVKPFGPEKSAWRRVMEREETKTYQL